MWKISCACVVPRRRKRPAEPGDAQRRGYVDRGAVGDVMKARRQVTGGDGVEVVVVAVDPVDGSPEGLIPALLIGDVADAEPDCDLGVAPDDVARRVERAVDVAERAYCLVVCDGTSRSVLSQMKSL